MVIELRVVQFWSEIILVISNQTRAARSFDFEITRMISDQIALHSVQLPIFIHRNSLFSSFFSAVRNSLAVCNLLSLKTLNMVINVLHNNSITRLVARVTKYITFCNAITADLCHLSSTLSSNARNISCSILWIIRVFCLVVLELNRHRMIKY